MRNRFFLGLVIFGVLTVVTASAALIFRASAATTNATRSRAMDENGKHFEIMYYWGPSGEQINASPGTVAGKIANAGFTIAPVRGSYNSMWTYSSLPSAIQTLDNYNLKTFVFEGSNADIAVASDPAGFYNQNIKPYTDFKNVMGYDVTDEPPINSTSGVAVGLDLVNVAVPRLYALDPMRESYVNLFPNYAPSDCLQYKTVTGCDAQGTVDLSAYEDYIAAYYNNSEVKTLSVDYYPKAKNNLTDSYSGYNDRDLYYSNLRSLLYHYKAKKNLNIETVPMNIVTLHDWYVDANSASQIRFQVSMNLAFGMKRMSYFTYMKPVGAVWTTGWMTEDGGVETTELMSIVSGVNAWAFNLGNELYTKEVGSVTQVYGTDTASVYRDGNIVDNNAYLGAITATATSGGAAQAVVTSFDDASFYIVNGEPNKEITVSWDGGVSLANSVIFNAGTGAWSGCYTALCSVASNYSVTLPAGGNILFHLGGGISNDTGVTVDREKRKVVLYSSQLSDVVNNVTATGKSLSGTTLTMAGETYDVLYPSSGTCTIRPAFVWTGMNGSYAGCNVTTNSASLAVGQVDSNYMYVKYMQNGGQVKNIPIVSGTVADYTVTGDTIKTNGESFDLGKVSVKNGVAEKSGSSLKVYTWPGKLLVATYSIDESAPVVDHAYFTNITVSSGTLSPVFSAGTLTYMVNVPYGVETLTVTGVGSTQYGVADVAQTKNLTAGEVTSFTLTAVDANQYSRTYTVNVTRAAPPTDYAYFADIQIMFGETDLSYLIDYDPDTTTYSISVPYEVDHLAVYGIGNEHVASVASEKPSLVVGQVNAFVLVANDGNYSRTYTINVTRANPPADHAYFTNITVSSGTLSPEFDAGTMTYAVEVPYSVGSLTVTGVGDAQYGVANDVQTKNLTAGGVTSFTLTAVDANQYSRTYTVNVTRAAAPVDHAYFTAVELTAGTIDFAPGTTVYSIAVGYTVESMTIRGVGDAQYGVADVVQTKPLTMGGTVTFTLTAVDENNYTRDYVFYVTRAAAPVDHAYFTNITLSSGSLTPVFSAGTTIYNVRVGNEVMSLTVTGVGDAQYGVADATLTKSLTAGAVTEFVLTARDENDFSRDYTVKVYREVEVVPPTDYAYFTNITVSSGTLTPVFSAGTTDYEVTVPYDVATIDVRATGDAAHGVADVSETGVELVPGQARTVTLTATDENYYTRDYKVVVTRELASANANLSLLEVSYELDGVSKKAALTPTFSPTTYGYAATVPDEAVNVTYSYSTADPKARAVGDALGVVTVAGTTVEINVTAEDGATKQKYTLTITREPPEAIEMVGVAKSQRTNDKELTAGKVTVVDTVRLINLKKNTRYKLKGGLKNASGDIILLINGDEEKVDEITTPGSTEGFRVTMELTLDSTPQVGGEVSVWLELFDAADDSLARLDGVGSEAQTVRVVRPTMASELAEEDEGVFRDKVTYTGLTPESNYTIRGELWRVDESGEKVSLVQGVTKSFTSSVEDNAVGVKVNYGFEVEAPCRVKAFEKTYYGDNAEPFMTSESEVVECEAVSPDPGGEDEPGEDDDSGKDSGRDSGVPKAPNTGRGGLLRGFVAG